MDPSIYICSWVVDVNCDFCLLVVTLIASDSGKEKYFCFDALGTKIWDSLLGPATTFTCVLKLELALATDNLPLLVGHIT